MLTLEVDLLTGAYRAALPDGSGPEWPPHPERVFSALVQAWADGGARGDERAALEWLERLEPPDIEAAPEGSDRSAPTVFVPPNDLRGDELKVLPERRPRQARTFAARIPESSLVRLRWPAEAPGELHSPLQSLAARVASLGHSSSLVRCRFSSEGGEFEPDRTWRPSLDAGRGVRVPYAGRMDDLERWFSRDGGKRAERPRTRRTVRYSLANGASERGAPRSCFGGAEDWFVFEDAGGFRPDLLAFPIVARRVRDALMSLGPQPASEVISGHAADGQPSARPHATVVPLANVGWEHANGDLLGFAVVLPAGLNSAERDPALRAIAALARLELGGAAKTELRLTPRATWELVRSASPARASLQPDRYCRAARRWATVTPLLLDRFAKGDDPLEQAGIVAAACRDIGLPEPIEIEIHKHSLFGAAPSAYPARGVKHRPSYGFPQSSRLAHRPRRHVVLRFAEPVAGPVILGAGRYHGLGLCLPVPGGDTP